MGRGAEPWAGGHKGWQRRRDGYQAPGEAGLARGERHTPAVPGDETSQSAGPRHPLDTARLGTQQGRRQPTRMAPAFRPDPGGRPEPARSLGAAGCPSPRGECREGPRAHSGKEDASTSTQAAAAPKYVTTCQRGRNRSHPERRGWVAHWGLGRLDGEGQAGANQRVWQAAAGPETAQGPFRDWIWQ